VADLGSWFEANRVAGRHHLEECHEGLKLRLRVLGQAANASWAAEAETALSANPTGTLSVWQVIKTHKTLVKAGVSDATFKARAKEMFPLATYFNAE